MRRDAKGVVRVMVWGVVGGFVGRGCVYSQEREGG